YRRTPAMRRAIGVVGVAASVYGAASLAGGWLGEPPWWNKVRRDFVWVTVYGEDVVPPSYKETRTPREGREWISGGVAAVGLALVAVAAWPRRSRPPGESTPG